MTTLSTPTAGVKKVTEARIQYVDFRSPEAPRIFSQSLRETGFAVIQNHTIAPELIRQAFQDWQDLFADTYKQNYLFDPKLQSGFFPFRTENAKDSKIKDLKEFYHVYREVDLPREIGPSTRQLRKQLIEMADTALTWLDHEIPATVRTQLSMPLNQMTQGSEQTLLRVIHYPPLTGGEEQGAIRAAAHEDINLITLLPAATAPGLQVKGKDGAWYAVDCDPGNIVVNAGDMLQLATSGYYVSTTHRVVNPMGEEAKLPRYSMPLFLHPRSEVPLSKTQTAGAYLDERLKEIGLRK